jgi:hypothetical protein
MRPLIFPQYTRSIGYGCIVEIEPSLDRGGIWPWADAGWQAQLRQLAGLVGGSHTPKRSEGFDVTMPRPSRTRLRAHQAWPFYRFISYTAKIEVERRRGGAGCSRMRPRSGLGSGDGAATAGTLEAEKRPAEWLRGRGGARIGVWIITGRQ